MAPTVGQVVHYYVTRPHQQSNGQGEGPYPAIVTQVFTGTMANLKVLPPFAAPYDVGSVSHRDEETRSSEEWWVAPSERGTEQQDAA